MDRADAHDLRKSSNTTLNLPLPDFGPQSFLFQEWFSVRNSQCKLDVKKPYNVQYVLTSVLYASGILGVGDDKYFYTQTGS